MKTMADYRIEALALAIKWNKHFKVPPTGVIAVADLFERYIILGSQQLGTVTDNSTKELLVEKDENVS